MAKFRCVPPGTRWLGGVCAGLAYAVGAPVWIIRLGWFIAAWFWGVGVLAYILLWIFAPKWDALPADYAGRTGD